jgi:hypothetical protein
MTMANKTKLDKNKQTIEHINSAYKNVSNVMNFIDKHKPNPITLQEKADGIFAALAGLPSQQAIDPKFGDLVTEFIGLGYNTITGTARSGINMATTPLKWIDGEPARVEIDQLTKLAFALVNPARN